MKIRPDLELIVFDLGNVLIDIDYAKAMSTMKSVIPIHLHPKVDQCYSAEFHKAYERGELDSSTFRNEFRNYFEQYWSDDEVDALWNSLLGSLPAYRLDLIRQLLQYWPQDHQKKESVMDQHPLYPLGVGKSPDPV